MYSKRLGKDCHNSHKNGSNISLVLSFPCIKNLMGMEKVLPGIDACLSEELMNLWICKGITKLMMEMKQETRMLCIRQW